MQPIVFLDFDGPIRTNRAKAAGTDIDPLAVRAIQRALRTAGARLVVIANLRLSGREECLRVLDSVEGYALSPFLHSNWAIGGRDEHPMALTRGSEIGRWLSENDTPWEAALVIDDLPIQKHFVMARQAIADTYEGLSSLQLGRIQEWADERRAAR